MMMMRMMVTASPSTVASGCWAIARPPILIIVSRWEGHTVVNPDNCNEHCDCYVTSCHDYCHENDIAMSFLIINLVIVMMIIMIILLRMLSIQMANVFSPVWKTRQNVVIINWFCSVEVMFQSYTSLNLHIQSVKKSLWARVVNKVACCTWGYLQHFHCNHPLSADSQTPQPWD